MEKFKEFLCWMPIIGIFALTLTLMIVMGIIIRWGITYSNIKRETWRTYKTRSNCFETEEKAEEYVKIENAKLPLEQADKCEECLWKWKMAFEHNDEKPKCFNPDKYKTCQNYFKYSGISPLFMEEYEVEEWKFM